MRKTIDVNDLSPTEFEKWCLKILTGYAEEDQLKNFVIKHNKRIKTPDGNYQIDIFSSFTALGSEFDVLCECKRYKRRVKRERIELLQSRLQSICAQKGIFITTSDYQSGAIAYAKAHKISLIKVVNYNFENASYSIGEDNNLGDDDPFLTMENKMPPYEAFDVTNDNNKIFPTRSIISELLSEMDKRIKGGKQ